MKLSDFPWKETIKVGLIIAGSVGLWEQTGAREAVMKPVTNEVTGCKAEKEIQIKVQPVYLKCPDVIFQRDKR